MTAVEWANKVEIPMRKLPPGSYTDVEMDFAKQYNSIVKVMEELISEKDAEIARLKVALERKAQ